MKIAHIAPPFYKVEKNQGYGGIERIILSLVEEQIKINEVAFIGVKGSTLENAEIYASSSAELGFFDCDNLLPEGRRKDYLLMEHISKSMELINKINPDIVHLHDDYMLPFVQFINTPTLLTLHSPLEDFWSKTYSCDFNGNLIAVSQNQKDIYEKAGFCVYSVVYNGLPNDIFNLNQNPSKLILSLSAIREAKGQDIALAAYLQFRQKRSDMDLVIAGNIGEPEFFNEKIKPYIEIDISNEQAKFEKYQKIASQNQQGYIFYVGAVNDAQKFPFFNNAYAFLFPTQWEEPFGLVAVEAMSQGTPVIGTRKGALPELIEDGKTGFIVNNEEEMAQKLECIPHINRKTVFSEARQRFSGSVMNEAYENIYKSLIKA